LLQKYIADMQRVVETPHCRTSAESAIQDFARWFSRKQNRYREEKRTAEM